MNTEQQKRIDDLKEKMSNIQTQIEENYKVRQELYKQQSDIDNELHKLLNGNLDSFIGQYIRITIHTGIDDIYYFCKLEKLQVIADKVDFYGMWLNYTAFEYISVEKKVQSFKNGSFDVECISKEEFKDKFDKLVANANKKLFDDDAEKQKEDKKIFNIQNIKLD